MDIPRSWFGCLAAAYPACIDNTDCIAGLGSVFVICSITSVAVQAMSTIAAARGDQCWALSAGLVNAVLGQAAVSRASTWPSLDSVDLSGARAQAVGYKNIAMSYMKSALAFHVTVGIEL